jgi:hypothetical protein
LSAFFANLDSHTRVRLKGKGSFKQFDVMIMAEVVLDRVRLGSGAKRGYPAAPGAFETQRFLELIVGSLIEFRVPDKTVQGTAAIKSEVLPFPFDIPADLERLIFEFLHVEGEVIVRRCRNGYERHRQGGDQKKPVA